MSTVNQYDKRSGITYVYESKSYWDKEKKQPRSKRTLIGRLLMMSNTFLYATLNKQNSFLVPNLISLNNIFFANQVKIQMSHSLFTPIV